MIKWKPETCKCEIECISPSKRGIFIKKCNIHSRSNDTRDVYAHDILPEFRFRSINQNMLKSVQRKIRREDVLTQADQAILDSIKIIQDHKIQVYDSS